MTVAINAPVNGKALPLIAMSHGTGGSYLGHFDTAIALADAGFVVVLAAPALGFTFSPMGLKNVKVPVQLWRAENDVVVPHPRYAEAVRLALPEAPDYHVVANAGHYDFLAP